MSASVSDLLMWCLTCRPTNDELRKSRLIDKELKREKRNLKKKQTILLLGTGESGKTTFLKQMKIIHGSGFSLTESEYFKSIIYNNIMKSFRILLIGRKQWMLDWENESSPESAEALGNLQNTQWSFEQLQPLVPHLKLLWQDKSLQTVFERRNEIRTQNFGDNIQHFMKRIDVIVKEDYVPSEDDIVWARSPTRGSYSEMIRMKDILFEFVDVGGQTLERRKWVQCFSDVQTILFLIACSQYDEFYTERGSPVNKLQESLDVFNALVNNQVLIPLPIIAFFNKHDLLEDKLANKRADIKDNFPDFSGDPYSVSDVDSFIADLFSSRMGQLADGAVDNQGRQLRRGPYYRHFTVAVDRDNMRTVSHIIQDQIMRTNLAAIMVN